MGHKCYTIGKIKTRSNDAYRKILSDERLFELPDYLDNHVEYSPSHKLEDDSCYSIKLFSEKEYSLDILRDEFTSAEYKQLLSTNEVDKLEYLFSYQNNTYYFQNITPSQLRFRRFITLGDRYLFDPKTRNITIKEEPDAVYCKVKDVLYFKNLSAITKIFKGINALYREATEEEVIGFLDQEFISLSDGFSSKNVKQMNRKRIAQAIETLDRYDDKQMEHVLNSIRYYFPDLVSKNDTSFLIGSEQDLKLLLYGVEQRLYTTPDGRENRIANSILVINKTK